MSSFRTLTKLSLAAVASLLLIGARASYADAFCFVDLVANTAGACPGAVSFVLPPAGGKSVVKVNLNKPATGFSKARFHVHFRSAPAGNVVNIGDSATNDQGGGDAGTQSNDAEMQLIADTLSLYGNDATPAATKNLLTVKNIATVDQTVVFEVRNNFFGWNGNNVQSQYLYALAGQADGEGAVNHDIYAAFNRVISLASPRVGTGVSWVMIQLVP